MEAEPKSVQKATKVPKNQKGDRVIRDQTECPEEKANFISRVLYWWLNPIFVSGYKRPLEKSDLWALSSRFHAKKLADEFEKDWEKEIEAFHAKKLLKRQKEESERIMVEKSEKIGKSGNDVEKGEKAMAEEETPSLYGSMRHFIFWKLLPIGFIKLLTDVCTVASPYVLKLIIDYVSAPSSEETPLWLG